MSLEAAENRFEKCKACDGSGGVIRDVDGAYWGVQAQLCDCRECDGTGEIEIEPPNVEPEDFADL